MWSGESVAVTQDSLIGLIAECSDKGGATRGAEDVELGRISEVCVRLGIPPSAVEHALSVLLPPTPDSDTPPPVSWKRLVVALCAQVEGIEDVKGFVRLLLDPQMFGDDTGGFLCGYTCVVLPSCTASPVSRTNFRDLLISNASNAV